ncbi:MAG: carboxylate-amine ligase [Alphaproteobacteria bacterium]|nr:carboxylate-amine ligase [Alphaproteobacteria bacterium]
MDDLSFSVGIEEEYLLVDPETRNLAQDADRRQGVIDSVVAHIGEEIGFATPEFLRAQVEIGTGVAPSIKDVRAKLSALRRAVSDGARAQGLEIIAASTHPKADWRELLHTDKDRYNTLAHDLQGVARRLVICGMHVHVGIDDDDLRIDLLGQVAYFLPHLLALSTSSPFWNGRDTGLQCYRLSIFDELPRTGLPERFDSWSDYSRHVQTLVDVGVIEEPTKIWWDIRPHCKFPTLEMRIPDICTYMEDGITIAALYASILSMLIRLRRSNQRWRGYSNMLINENRWRAQRHGATQGMVDFGSGKMVDYAELLEEILMLTKEDQERLDCVEEAQNARRIIARGASSQTQRRIYHDAVARGASNEEALNAVVDWLIEETVRDL